MHATTSLLESEEEDVVPINVNDEGYFFLSAEARNALPNYRYAGEDKSLLYRFVLSPLASFLINNITPRTIAPNSITLMGLCFMIASYLLFWYYSPTLQSQDIDDDNQDNENDNDDVSTPPSYIFLFHFCAMLIYQTLDNMDGKQARRTGSSTPLGVLFDHGCDAVNSIFGSANWIICIGIYHGASVASTTENDDHDANNTNWMLWALVMGPMALFYIATWEEYYCGKLILPIMNGPNEGLLLGAITSLLTCLYGVSYWQSTTWYDAWLAPWIPNSTNLTPWTNADVQVWAACIGFVQETVLKSLSVAKSYGWHSLLDIVPFAALLMCTFWIGVCDEEVWTRAPRTSLHLCSGLFVDVCTQLMLDHISMQECHPFRRWTLVPLVVLTVMIWKGVCQASDFTDAYLMVYTSALWTYLVMKMTIVIHEICSVLQIWCFDIVTPRRPRVTMVSANGSLLSSSKHH